MFVVSDELCDEVRDARMLLSSVLPACERTAVLQGRAWTICGPVSGAEEHRPGEKRSGEKNETAPGCAQANDERA
ncbi:MAG: hypothetical protein R6X12_09590 [bacterium]